jgi:hypothetical protein|tara:strand:- start:102 stop:395 length:294 start_codon:yes stop_codon:yes gene_type:complete
MPRHHLINGIQVPFTAQEEIEWDAKEQAWKDGAFDRAMADLRQRRNRLLAECDWVMVSDSPITDKTDWETYRTNLRDITEGLSTVEQVKAVEFPTKP